MFLLSPHSFGMADLQLGVIRTLRRTGVRIVKLSGTSSAITPDGPYVCRQHWEIERVLAESGQPYVILRPNSFMQVLVGRLMISGTARHRNGDEPDRPGRNQPHRRSRRRHGRRPRADPATPGTDRRSC